MLPCDLDHKRHPGPNHHFYAALLNGSDTIRGHLRLCKDHSDVMLELAEPYLVEIDTGYISQPLAVSRCVSCNTNRGGPFRSFFLTAYPQSEERRDFYCIIHTDCRPLDWMEQILRLT